MKIPDDPAAVEHLEDAMREIDLPPVEPLAFGRRGEMMIVMPPFPERDQGDQKVVAGIVLRRKTPAADNVSQRVDEKRAVVDQHRAHEEPPHQHLRGSGV